MRKTISVGTLNRYNACYGQRILFIEAFGNTKPVPITWQTVKIAANNDLNVEWFLIHGLSREQFRNYARSRRRLYSMDISYDEFRDRIYKLQARWLRRCK